MVNEYNILTKFVLLKGKFIIHMCKVCLHLLFISIGTTRERGQIQPAFMYFIHVWNGTTHYLGLFSEIYYLNIDVCMQWQRKLF